MLELLQSHGCVTSFFCVPRLKIFKIWRRMLVVEISKPMKPIEDIKSYQSISLLRVPIKDPREVYLTPALNQLSIQCYLGSKTFDLKIKP